MPTVKPVKKPSSPKKKQQTPKTRGGDVINLAPLISAVLLAAAKLSLEKKKTKSAAPAAPASTVSKSRTRSR